MDLLFGPVTISAISHGYTATWWEKDGTFHRALIPESWNSWIHEHIYPWQIRDRAPCWIHWEMLKEESTWVATVKEEIRNSELFQELPSVACAKN